MNRQLDKDRIRITIGLIVMVYKFQWHLVAEIEAFHIRFILKLNEIQYNGDTRRLKESE